MNRYYQERWSWIDGSHTMRTQLLDSLSDAELAFTPGGANPSLGALFREMGEVEHAYLQSLQTLTQDWSFRNTEPGLDSSVERLKAWFQSLDDQMKATVEGLSDDDLEKPIDRGGYPMPIDMQLDVYLQALLIFFGKAVVYCKAMGRELSPQFKEYIG